MKPWFLSAMLVLTGCASVQAAGQISQGHELTQQIEGVVDGDTLQLKNGTQLRLIGVDCPEMSLTNEDQLQLAKNELSQPRYSAYSEVAKSYVEDFLKRPGTVRIVADSQHESVNHMDHLDRILAYVYVGDEMLNANMLREGICLREVEIRYERIDEFREYEKSAKNAKIGIWEDSD